MLEKDRLNRILALALPILGGMVSQNILNLVDTAMVSRLEYSNAALAAVGLGGFLLFVTQAIILGFGMGVQASASRRKGQGRVRETALFLNAALVIVIAIAPLLSVLVINVVPKIYPLINADEQVIALGVPYLQIRAFGIVFVAMNYSECHRSHTVIYADIDIHARGQYSAELHSYLWKLWRTGIRSAWRSDRIGLRIGLWHLCLFYIRPTLRTCEWLPTRPSFD